MVLLSTGVVVYHVRERLIAENETRAIEAIQTIFDAQRTFAMTCGDGRFATNLIDLGDSLPDGQQRLPWRLSMSTTTVVEGYLVKMRAVPGPDFMSADSCTDYPLADNFYLTAEPHEIRWTARRAFAADRSGIWAVNGLDAPVLPFGPPAVAVQPERAGGVQTKAPELLGMSFSSFHYYAKKFNAR